jgi:hypothetical protein
VPELPVDSQFKRHFLFTESHLQMSDRRIFCQLCGLFFGFGSTRVVLSQKIGHIRIHYTNLHAQRVPLPSGRWAPSGCAAIVHRERKLAPSSILVGPLDDTIFAILANSFRGFTDRALDTVLLQCNAAH